MNNKKIPVCLLGAGRIGLFHEFDKKRIKPASHAGMWYKYENTNLTAICDVNLKSKKIIKKIDKKIKFFSDPKKMLEQMKPKIVSIATWKDTHFKLTMLCIKKGIKVIVLEKPLANNIKQSKKLIYEIKKNKIKVIVNHRRRFDNEIIKLKKKLDEGYIGDILQISSYYVYGLLTTGTHVIDTLRFLLKDIAGEVDHVFGFKNKFKNFCSKDDKNYDAIISFKNGLKASMQSLNLKDYDIFDFYIYGSKGKILITGIGRNILKFKIIKSPEHEGFEELDIKGKHICNTKPRKQFITLAQNAVSCLKNKTTQPMCSAYDSHIDMLIIQSIQKSANSNSKKIKIKY